VVYINGMLNIFIWYWYIVWLDIIYNQF